MCIRDRNTIDVAGHFRETAPRSAAEAAINLGVSLILVGKLGIYGVLLGTLAALLYRTNDIILYASRRLLKRSSWQFYRVYLVNAAVFGGVAAVGSICPVTVVSWSGFLAMGLALTIGIGTLYGMVGVIAFPKVRRRVGQTIVGMRKKN